ncbi:MAG TPA: ABC transporter permease [Baekduia sp.]|uniref:ABC transporter permease n=1 Tax=Baekduia sp. TaxID=2600305 RepID=UPI002D79337D|nr:ABC transporter permease [Baekduia sp.]HET6507791.1 ABC transporter permease [Baekduia sp.]
MSRTDATLAAEEAELDDAVPTESSAWWARLATVSSLWIGLILVGLIVAFSILEPSTFLSVDNGRNISTDAAILLVLAVGQTFVIITAGIDLAVGSTLVFAGVISAKMMHTTGGDNGGTVVVGLISGLVAGGAWGLLNGFLVAKAKITPLIVTLGTFGMALGAALVITKGIDEREIPYKLIDGIGTGRVFGQVPWLVVIALGVALGFGILLAQTRFGRYTLAIGSNPEAARRAGIDVDRHLMKVYTLAGVLAGLAGFLSLARFGTTTIGGHSTDNLQSITAVVIGGTSLFGGIGSILGTVFGVFIPAVLQNGFVITGVQPFWQQIAVGAVLVAAVYLDQLRRSRNR